MLIKIAESVSCDDIMNKSGEKLNALSLHSTYREVHLYFEPFNSNTTSRILFSIKLQ